MRQRVFCLVGILFAFTVLAITSSAQSGQSSTASQAGGPGPQAGGQTLPPGFIVPKGVPHGAVDITKADIDMLLKNPLKSAIDQPMRIVDAGKYNIGVAIVRRDDPDSMPPGTVYGPYHDSISEVYIILSGTAVLVTGGMSSAQPHAGYSVTSGDGGNGFASRGDDARTVHAGDVVIIPPGVLHAFTEISDPIRYLVVRVDPDRVLPAGYISPLMLKNLPEPAPKPAAPANAQQKMPAR